VAPTDPLPVVRFDAKDRQRSLAGRSQLTMFAARPRILVAAYPIPALNLRGLLRGGQSGFRYSGALARRCGRMRPRGY
jgi:hypothetical protein